MDWQSYKEKARARGALAQEVYVVRSTPVADAAAIAAVLPDHLAYVKGLELDDRLMLAGPVSDPDGAAVVGGMLILRADSFETARALAERDPMHIQGLRRFELRRWLINEGSISVRLTLSTQTADLT